MPGLRVLEIVRALGNDNATKQGKECEQIDRHVGWMSFGQGTGKERGRGECGRSFKEERTDERVRASVWQEEKWKA